MALTATILILLLIAFFSGIEIAFVSANKLRIELLKEKGNVAASIMARFTRTPAKFISTLLVGLNICVVAFGSICSDIFNPENFPFLPKNDVALLLVQTFISTFIILIFGELLPKILFRVNSDATLLLFAYPVYLVYIILSPISNLFHFLSKKIISVLLRKKYIEKHSEFTEEDLEYLVKETAASDENSGDEADELNSEMFEKALYLREVKVRNCMVPRTEIAAVSLDEGIEGVRKKMIETRHSRIFIYDENIDNIIGYVHHFDLLKDAQNVKDILWQPLVVPETMNARDLLTAFTREKKNIAWVVDEYGGTAGIVTLEDVMEEIFGEIHDEYDEEELTEKKLDENTYILSARLEIDHLNEKYGLEIPTGEYETLGGFIVNAHESIPAQGETLEIERFVIKILKASTNRIELVELKVQ
ncbi:MAG: hemolysin family protein [Chitinophagales bacterium]|nr:hemolysin family protein [Chitinophagales bacterium]MDW8273702.1 hemolysin family protein [Chitinophagales bacterium]